MKKLSAVLLAFALVFSNVGTVVFHDSGDVTVEAKSYKSGKKGSAERHSLQKTV